MKHGQLPQINMSWERINKLYELIDCPAQSCQREVPDMQLLSMEIIIEHDLLLHFNTK